MFYDQAMLSMAYIEAYQTTEKDEFKETARAIITYVLRDMTDPDGGFYSAEDADSEGEEGKFYLWNENEIRQVLGDADAELIIKLFNVRQGGNFKDQASGQFTGQSILHLADDHSSIASKLALSSEDLGERASNALQR